MQDFSGAEPLLDRPIAFHPCFMPVTTKCVVGALFLSQAWYWRTKGRKADGWVFKTHYEFFEETGLSQKQQIRVRKELCKKSWWQEKVEKVNGVPTYHYRIDRIGLMAELKAISEKLRGQPIQKEFSENSQREFSENSQREFSENSQREFSENSQREFSLYKEAEITNREYLTETTHTNPERACEKSDFEIFDSEPDSEPSTPLLALPSPAEELASTNSPSSSQQVPPPITNPTVVASTQITHGAALAHDRAFRQAPPSGELISQLVDIYNKYKPDYWGKCTAIGSHIPRQAARLLSEYSDIQSLISDWGGAILALKANDFYNSPKFGSGNISFLLDPNKPDRIPRLAQEWRDRPQQQKEQLANEMVAAKTGIPRWENPDVVLKGAMLHLRRDRYKRYVKAQQFDRSDCPSIEYLQTYFPEIFED